MKLRIKFSKHGAMRFIGHLDMMRYFQKAIRRAEVDISYSTGFSPHQKMSFAAPLGVGVESNGEYMDIEVNSYDSLQQVKDSLNAQMAEGVTILNVIELPEDAKNAMSSVAAAKYTIFFRDRRKPAFDLQEAVTKLLSMKGVIITKETKKNTLDIDIRPYIYELSATEDTISMFVDASSANNVKPAFVVDSLYRISGEEHGEFDFWIQREDTYCLNRKKKFVPLDQI